MFVRPAACLVLVALPLAACDAGVEAPLSAPAATGRLRFVNASPDTTRAKAVNVRIDGVPWVANQAYKAGTGYVLALPGERQVEVRKTTDTTVVVLTQAVTVAANGDYTVLPTGLAPDLTGLVLDDDNVAPPAGNVRIRIVHASPAAGAVDVYVTAPGADLATETPDTTNLGYRSASAYLTLPVGSHRIRWTAPGTITVVGDTTTAALATGQIRTVALLDRAGGGTPHTYVILSDR
jgi:uncharacterized protein DUF4397